MNIRCSAHRLLPWLGHGECSSCGALFKHLLEAPEACPNCNARLQPWAKHRRVEELFRALEGVRGRFLREAAVREVLGGEGGGSGERCS